jgi:hypothetical protein
LVVPNPPTKLQVYGISHTQLRIEWDEPEFAENVAQYIVEWDTVIDFNSGTFGNPMGSQTVLSADANPRKDVQAISISGPSKPSGFPNQIAKVDGTFRVLVYGQKTPPLHWDVSALDMEAALNALTTVRHVDVERNVVGHGFTWLVTFTDMLYGGSQYGRLAVDKTGLKGTGSEVQVKDYPAVLSLKCTSTKDVSVCYMDNCVTVSHSANAAAVKSALAGFGQIDVKFSSDKKTVCDNKGDATITFALDMDDISVAYPKKIAVLALAATLQ